MRRPGMNELCFVYFILFAVYSLEPIFFDLERPMFLSGISLIPPHAQYPFIASLASHPVRAHRLAARLAFGDRRPLDGRLVDRSIVTRIRRVEH